MPCTWVNSMAAMSLLRGSEYITLINTLRLFYFMVLNYGNTTILHRVQPLYGFYCVENWYLLLFVPALNISTPFGKRLFQSSRSAVTCADCDTRAVIMQRCTSTYRRRGGHGSPPSVQHASDTSAMGFYALELSMPRNNHCLGNAAGGLFVLHHRRLHTKWSINHGTDAAV